MEYNPSSTYILTVLPDHNLAPFYVFKVPSAYNNWNIVMWEAYQVYQ